MTEQETFARRAQREFRDFVALWRHHRILASLLLIGLAVYAGLWFRDKILSGGAGHINAELSTDRPQHLCTFSADVSGGEAKVACSGVPDTAVAGLLEALKEVSGRSAKVDAANDWARQYYELKAQYDALQARFPQAGEPSEKDPLREAKESLEAGRLSDARQELLSSYQRATYTVLLNVRKLFAPAMNKEEQELEQQVVLQVLPTMAIESGASWASSGERRVSISAGLVQLLEMTAIGFSVEENAKLPGCGAAYAGYIVSIANRGDLQSKSIQSLEEFGRRPRSKCLGSPDAHESGGDFFAKMMDASIATLYLRGVASHVLGLVPRGGAISLHQNAAVTAWTNMVASRANFHLQVAEPLLALEGRGLMLPEIEKKD